MRAWVLFAATAGFVVGAIFTMALLNLAGGAA